MPSEPDQQLERAIHLPHATAMVVGTIIGASIFVQPSEITGQVNSVTGVFLVWLVAGTLTLFGSLVCAELSSIYTKSGGVYIYLTEAYSPSVGFLWGWAMFWSMHSGIIAAISVVFARYVGFFVPLEPAGLKIVAVALIVLLSLVNYRGVRHGSTLQTTFTIGKLAAIALIIFLGVLLGSRVPQHFQTSGPSQLSLRGFGLAVSAGLFAFGGWHMVTYNSEETVHPQATIPRALLYGSLIVTACYVAMNAVYMYVLPLDTLASSTRVAADAANAVIGSGGGAVMSALVIFSTFGALSGIILSGPRVYFSMARDGLLFNWLATVHRSYRTPHRAIVIQAMWSSILVLTGTYRTLFTRVVYTEWIFFGLMALGLILLRRRNTPPRGYFIWGYPVVPVIFVAASLLVVTNQIVSDPTESILGLSFVLVGLPVYLFWANKARKESVSS
ncbi:MAG: APC family permease [Gemmatimonadales bacterium]